MLKPVYYNGIVLYPDILVGYAGCGIHLSLGWGHPVVF